MNIRTVFAAFLLSCFLSLSLQAQNVPDLASLSDQAINRKATVVKDGNKTGIKLTEGEGQGLVWIPNVVFSTGTIEVSIRGKDVFQKSFVGIAFNGTSNTEYEVVYLRPFNFQAEDPVRKSHAIQYVYHPEFTWDKLRSKHPDKFESGVPDTLQPNEWVRLRIHVLADRVDAFVENSQKPVLSVPRLSKISEGTVGLWVGEGSDGEFADLKIEPQVKKSSL